LYASTAGIGSGIAHRDPWLVASSINICCWLRFVRIAYLCITKKERFSVSVNRGGRRSIVLPDAERKNRSDASNSRRSHAFIP
jgi:hypothetical protein